MSDHRDDRMKCASRDAGAVCLRSVALATLIRLVASGQRVRQRRA